MALLKSQAPNWGIVSNNLSSEGTIIWSHLMPYTNFTVGLQKYSFFSTSVISLLGKLLCTIDQKVT